MGHEKEKMIKKGIKYDCQLCSPPLACEGSITIFSLQQHTKSMSNNSDGLGIFTWIGGTLA